MVFLLTTSACFKTVAAFFWAGHSLDTLVAQLVGFTGLLHQCRLGDCSVVTNGWWNQPLQAVCPFSNEEL